MRLATGWPNPLTVPYGGTGVATFAANGVVYGNTAGVLLVTAQGAANSVLTANAGAPSFSATPTITGLTVTNAPTFTAMTLGSVLFAGAAGVLTQDNANFFYRPSTPQLVIGTNVAASGETYLFVGPNLTNNTASHRLIYGALEIANTAANNTNFQMAFSGQVTIGATNTKDFTGSFANGGVGGLSGAVVANSGALGTITNAQIVRSSFSNTTMAVTNAYLFGGKFTAGSGVITSAAGVAIPSLVGATNHTGLLLGTVTIPTGTFGVYSISAFANYFGGAVGIQQTAPTSLLHLAAGTATAGTSPLGFTSGPLLTVPVAGKVEFLTDKWYGTITTGAARNTFAFLESPAFVTPNLGTPSAGVVTNLTGTASININGTVGAGTPTTAAFTTASTTGQFTGVNVVLSGPLDLIATGAAPQVGSATLGVGGTVTVNTTAATATCHIFFQRKTSGGTIGMATTYTVNAGTSFTVSSDNVLDTSTFSWWIVETH